MEILDKLAKALADKQIKTVTPNNKDLVLTFTDDTRLKVKSPQFFEAGGTEAVQEKGKVVDFPFKRRMGRELVETELHSMIQHQIESFGPEALQMMLLWIKIEMNRRGINPEKEPESA